MTEVTLEFDRTPWAPAYMLRGALPARRRRDLSPAIVARWHGHRASPRALAEFLRLTGLPVGPALPLLYPYTFGFRLSMAVLTHPAFPVPIWGVLQTRIQLAQRAPVSVDATVDLETRVGAGRAVDKGAEIDLHTVVRAAGVPAWESVVTFFLRGRFGDPDPSPPLASAPPAGGPQIAEWAMADEAHWRFGSFTGDYNGIHAWDWYARRFGFRRALYHPARVLGQCLARLGAGAGEPPARLDAWLKGPVPHGAGVRLHARPDTAGTVFALHVERERPCIVGRLAGPG